MSRTKRKTKKTKRMYEAVQAATVALLSRLAPPVASAPAAWTPETRPQLPARFTAEIREGAGAFVVLIIAAAAIVIAAAVAVYVLNALGPAAGNEALLQQGQQAIQNTVSSFAVVASLLGALVVGIIAFGFLKRIWREFVGA